MIPDSLHLGPIPIHLFGIFLALALVVASWVAGREFARRGFDPTLASETALWAGVGGLVGARLWIIVETWPEFAHAPLSFVFSGSGLAWYGGFVGGALAVTLQFRRRSIPWLAGADALAPALALGHAIGRIGCQVAGDGDWGTETTLPWGMAYPHAVVGWDKPPGVRVHPTPLYECAAYLAVFAYLWWRRKAPAPSGTTFSSYLVLAGLARFAIEFVRINPRVAFGLSGAQLMSAALVVIGVAFLWVKRVKASRAARRLGP